MLFCLYIVKFESQRMNKQLLCIYVYYMCPSHCHSLSNMLQFCDHSVPDYEMHEMKAECRLSWLTCCGSEVYLFLSLDSMHGMKTCLISQVHAEIELNSSALWSEIFVVVFLVFVVVNVDKMLEIVEKLSDRTSDLFFTKGTETRAVSVVYMDKMLEIVEKKSDRTSDLFLTEGTDTLAILAVWFRRTFWAGSQMDCVGIAMAYSWNGSAHQFQPVHFQIQHAIFQKSQGMVIPVARLNTLTFPLVWRICFNCLMCRPVCWRQHPLREIQSPQPCSQISSCISAIRKYLIRVFHWLSGWTEQVTKEQFQGLCLHAQNKE